MIVCEVVEEIIEEKTYGFRFYDDSNGEVVCTVRDVFDDYGRAECFKKVINESNIDAVHIGDIIEDIISA